MRMAVTAEHNTSYVVSAHLNDSPVIKRRALITKLFVGCAQMASLREVRENPKYPKTVYPRRGGSGDADA